MTDWAVVGFFVGVGFAVGNLLAGVLAKKLLGLFGAKDA